MECSICGISDKMRNVSQALSSKGIVLACDRCLKNEGFILLKKPKVIEENSKETMYQRMARLAGVVPKDQPERLRASLSIQEKSLREIVDKNYEKKIAASKEIMLKPRQDLVDNFHWIIMRVRRVKGLTQGQLAERITEPEAAIKMAEQGVVPEGYTLIDKLERFLGVRLIKQRDLSLPLQRQREHLQQQLYQPANPVSQQPHQQTQLHQQEQTTPEQKSLAFDKHSLGALTIADLKRMREEKEASQMMVNTEEENERKDESPKPYDRLDYE